jgi:hypothetical protein
LIFHVHNTLRHTKTPLSKEAGFCDLGFLPRADELPASRSLIHFSKKALGGVLSFALSVETRNRFSVDQRSSIVTKRPISVN